MSACRRVSSTAVALVSAIAVVSSAGAAAAASRPSDAGTPVSTWSELQAAFQAGGAVTLAADITHVGLDGLAVGYGSSVTLDLDGHALSISGVGRYTSAIQVDRPSSLDVLDSTGGGSLTVVGGAAGIGGAYGSGSSAGSITIEGGAVTATGGSLSAGIGGGIGGSAFSVSVTGGTVIARGGDDGAGIGGGLESSINSVAISGGSVTSTGGSGAAGIGGGASGAGYQLSVGSGATVTAVGGDGGSALGNGSGVGAYPGEWSNAGRLTVPAGSTLAVPSTAEFDNSGVLTLGGTLAGAGTVDNTGSVVAQPPGGSVDGNGQGPSGTALLVTQHNYALSFVTRGGEPAPVGLHVFAGSVAAGGQALPRPQTRPHTTFHGWYTAASGGTSVTSATDLSTVLAAGPSAATLYEHDDPTITAHLSSAHRASRYGWYRTPVTIRYTCTTRGAALTKPCPKPVQVTRSGAARRFTRTITARDGGTATVTTAVRLDRGAPSVRVGGVRDGGRYLASAPSPQCVATDAVSGVVSCRLTRTVRRTAVGERVACTATATDRAGNVSSTRSVVQVVDFGVASAGFRDGAYTVHRGHSYVLLAVAGRRPSYLDASPYPRRPKGADSTFARAGSVAGRPRWALTVTMTRHLRTHRYWNVGIRVGRVTHVIRLRVLP